MPELGRTGFGAELARSGGGGATLADLYAAGASVADQTLSLTDASGGGVVIDGSAGSGFNGANVLTVKNPAGSISMGRVGTPTILSNAGLQIGTTSGGFIVQTNNGIRLT